MPEYLSPGVYIEEFEIGAKPMEGVSTSTAGFLGETERGPTTPRLITSWLQYQRVFGGYFGNDKYLPGSVDGFFKNGGSRCYIGRIVKSDAESARLILKSIDKIPSEKDYPEKKKEKDTEILKEFTGKVLTVDAVGEGTWGNRIAVAVSAGTFSGIKMGVFCWKTEFPAEEKLANKEDLAEILRKQPPTVSELFDNISASEKSSDYYGKIVNGISNLIKISIDDEKKVPEPEGDRFANALPLENGGESIKASLLLASIDKEPLSVADFEDKFLKVEAVGEGEWGNKIKVKLDKGDTGIKLVVSYPEDTLDNILPEKMPPQSIIKVSVVDAGNSEEAKTDFANALPLENGGEGIKASLLLASIDKEPLNVADFEEKFLKVEAVGEGEWGNKITVKLDKGDTGIKLVVSYPEDTLDNVLPEKMPPQSIIKVSTVPVVTKGAKTSPQYLMAGSDGEGDLEAIDYKRDKPEDDEPGKRKGLTAFKGIEDISIVYAPNAVPVSGLVDALISHCENLRYRFAIFDALQGSSNVSNIDPRSDSKAGFRPTDYAAFYYPWIKVVNPDTGMLQLMPPGGYVAGIYARSDTERGVHKAPANEIVKGASDLEFQIMKGEQDVLNPRGVNVIRAFPGRGILVWGARTLSSNTLWKYINVRRLFIFIEASIERGTQWVVFEPNDDRLWARVRATINQFLTGVWRSGALMGTTPEEAFFIKCDRSTMTQDDIDNGRLICIIGIAPVKPAEFVIFRIAQWQGGSAATE